MRVQKIYHRFQEALVLAFLVLGCAGYDVAAQLVCGLLFVSFFVEVK